eukprot:10789493-Lingulodinium_polyedra.AAC.1
MAAVRRHAHQTRKKLRLGSLDHLASMEKLDIGPERLDHLLAWPGRTLEQLRDGMDGADRWERL